MRIKLIFDGLNLNVFPQLDIHACTQSYLILVMHFLVWLHYETALVIHVLCKRSVFMGTIEISLSLVYVS